MMERQDGGFAWSTSHNSPFEPSKLALMNFPRSIADLPPADLSLNRLNPDDTISPLTIKSVDLYKLLGVILNPKLRWTKHHQKVTADESRLL